MSDISKIKLPDGSEFNIKDAAVPSWAKAASKPSYTAEEVGAVAASQGAGNAGKFLGIDNTGAVVAMSLPVYNGGVS